MASRDSTRHAIVVDADMDAPTPLVKVSKQLKYVVLGGIGVWYWQVSLHLSDVLSGAGWSRILGILSVAIYLSTVISFAYLMLLPARGVRVDYIRWQKDRHLQTVIPIMTALIVIGFISMVLTLSPLCAPKPPSQALSQRLLEAANAAGANLHKARSGVQLLVSDAARSLGLNSASSSTIPGTDLDLSSLLRTLRLPDGEALAGRLGVKRDHTKLLISTLEKYQSRAQAWKENNVSVLGWTGAIIGSASAFTLLFGFVGLFGLLTPRQASVKSKKASL